MSPKVRRYRRAMRSPLGRPALVAISLVLGAAVLAACSSGGSSAGSDASPTSLAKTTTSAKPGGTDDGATGPLKRYASYQTKSYADPKHWVCRPDITDDICDGDLDTTIIDADGTLTPEPFERAKTPPIDCFYVYPTISKDATTYADWDFSDEEEGYVTLNQAARLQSQCRLFAPVYRQLTLNGLGSAMGGGGGAEKGDPFGDVLDAFKTYMANDNDGRGFVLIGHSQGSAMVNQLLQKEIDPNADVRAKLVGAYLAGGAVAVPKGELVGGDLDHIPLCSKGGQTSCVVTWATFRSTAPPPNGSFFGKPRASEGEAGCVNPAAVAGGSAELHAYFPANADASILGSLGTSTEGKTWLDASAGTIDTPFVSVPGLVTGRCASKDGFNYLEATIHPDASGPRADDIPGDLSPEWGLHLVDVNLVMGNVVDDVASQAAAYADTSGD